MQQTGHKRKKNLLESLILYHFVTQHLVTFKTQALHLHSTSSTNTQVFNSSQFQKRDQFAGINTTLIKPKSIPPQSIYQSRQAHFSATNTHTSLPNSITQIGFCSMLSYLYWCVCPPGRVVITLIGGIGTYSLLSRLGIKFCIWQPHLQQCYQVVNPLPFHTSPTILQIPTFSMIQFFIPP